MGYAGIEWYPRPYIYSSMIGCDDWAEWKDPAFYYELVNDTCAEYIVYSIGPSCIYVRLSSGVVLCWYWVNYLALLVLPWYISCGVHNGFGGVYAYYNFMIEFCEFVDEYY